ncbi:MAG: 50S ribosomal protein L29 [Candidatus Moraniibacteriota bacterium]|nr:MAG: 50S ribosomal protein L29 [Candidatus Moranbacteria bacterium]
MKIVELREKNVDELHVIADDLRADIHQKKLEISMNTASDHGVVAKNKKELARVMTVISEKERAA